MNLMKIVTNFRFLTRNRLDRVKILKMATNPPPPTTAESMKEKMNEILAKFQAALASDAWKDFTSTAEKNVAEMKKLAANGQQDLLNQLKKTNDEVLEKMRKSHAEARDKLTTELNQIKTQAGEQRDKSLAEFKKKYEEALTKVSDQSSKTYQAALKELQEFKGKSAAEFDTFQKNMKDRFEKSFNEVLDKLRF